MQQSKYEVWVDADACPKVLKEILCRAAIRSKTVLRFVANRRIVLPSSVYLKSVVVSAGYDKADSYIVGHVSPGDLVISADIPLAYDAIRQQAQVINYRGDRLQENDILQRMRMRDINEQLRSYGQLTGGPSPMDNKQKMAFANALDQWLSKYGGA